MKNVRNHIAETLDQTLGPASPINCTHTIYSELYDEIVSPINGWTWDSRRQLLDGLMFQILGLAFASGRFRLVSNAYNKALSFA